MNPSTAYAVPLPVGKGGQIIILSATPKINIDFISTLV